MKIRHGVCSIAFAALIGAAPAMAAQRNIMPDEIRALTAPRAFEVLVAQSEIKSSINPTDLSAASGQFGLLGAIIMAGVQSGINSDKAKKAEATILPLRTALTGFDADTLALEASKATAAAVPWLHTTAPTFGRDNSAAGESAFLDASATNEVVFFDYSYDAAWDFSSMRVHATMSIANKEVKPDHSPQDRVAPWGVVYTQTITSIVALDSPSKVASDNVARWTADGGKPARSALSMGFARVQQLMPTALALTKADAKAMQHDKKYMLVGELGGRVQPADASGTTLLFGPNYVCIEKLDAAPAPAIAAAQPPALTPVAATSSTAAPTASTPATASAQAPMLTPVAAKSPVAATTAPSAAAPAAPAPAVVPPPKAVTPAALKQVATTP